VTRRLPWLLGALAVLVAGVVVFAAASTALAVVYEGSYAPLEPEPAADVRWSVMWTAQHAIGAALVAAALLVLAFLGGWLLGRGDAVRSGASRPR
jgi:hypothetical protein